MGKSTKSAKRTAELDDMRLYTLSEVESVLGVSHRSLLTYVNKGQLKASKIGGCWKVTRASLKEFIDGKMTAK